MSIQPSPFTSAIVTPVFQPPGPPPAPPTPARSVTSSKR